MRNDITYARKPFLKRIATPGWWIIGIALAFIVSIFVRNYFVEKDQKEREDKLIDRIGIRIDTSLSKVGLKYDKNTGQITTLQPLLNIVSGPNYLFDRMTKDSITIALDIKNVSEGIAKNLTGRITTIKEESLGLVIRNKVTFESNSENYLVKDQIQTALVSYQYSSNLPSTIVYVYIDISYTDIDSLNEKRIRRIYKVPFPSNPQVIFTETGSDEFNKVKSFLTGQNAW